MVKPRLTPEIYSMPADGIWEGKVGQQITEVAIQSSMNLCSHRLTVISHGFR